ncbi:MAG TPA: hypothetical protein VFX25_13130, partial [Streptosporangiaceae bacterium]|nr:hypothetical protein [Streptosporangiaceae bacterium]
IWIYRRYRDADTAEKQALRRAAGLDERASVAATDAERREIAARAAVLRELADSHRATADDIIRRAKELGYLPPG